MKSKLMMSITLFTVLVSAPVFAQQIIYPAKGQSAQQQQKDEAECYSWAKGKTGYDPVQSVAPPPQQSVGGERVRGAAGGAAGGALIGAISGNAGKGAAIGAIGGTMVGGARKRRKMRENDQAMAQQQQEASQQKQNFQRAYGACFEGRGYTVR